MAYVCDITPTIGIGMNPIKHMGVYWRETLIRGRYQCKVYHHTWHLNEAGVYLNGAFIWVNTVFFARNMV